MFVSSLQVPKYVLTLQIIEIKQLTTYSDVYQCPDLGEVQCPDLGEVQCPDLGEVQYPDLGEV